MHGPFLTQLYILPSVFFSVVLASPTPNLYCTTSSAPSIQSGLFPHNASFFAAVQVEDETKSILNLKRTLAQGSCEKKNNQQTNKLKQIKSKCCSVPAFLGCTKKVYGGLAIKGKENCTISSAWSLTKAPSPKVHRQLYPAPLATRHWPADTHLSQTSLKSTRPFWFLLPARELWEE